MTPGSHTGHPPPFHPHWILKNPHLQTIVGLFLPVWTPQLDSKCVAVHLPDGDRLAIHVDTPTGNSNGRIVLLIHGLAGCHDSSYIRRTATKLVAHGFTSVRADLRGCGTGWNWAREAFHAGRTMDIDCIIRHLADGYPESPIDLVGFSLGGHLVLKYLGEAEQRLPTQLRAALVISPPLDLTRCSDLVRTSLAGIYDRYFAGKLWRHYRLRMEAGLLPNLRVNKPKSLLGFDHRITAPLAGFVSAESYYAAVSSHECLSAIQLPTDVLTSADDPMIPLDMIRSAAMSPCMRLHVLSAGGHLGFISDRPCRAESSPSIPLVSDRRWLDWQVVAWACGATPFSFDAR